YKSLDQRGFPGGGFHLVDLPVSAELVHSLELGADRSRVVVGVLGLLHDLLRYRERAAQRGRRQFEDARGQSHHPPPVKSYGAIGPTSRIRIRSCTASASSS